MDKPRGKRLSNHSRGLKGELDTRLKRGGRVSLQTSLTRFKTAGSIEGQISAAEAIEQFGGAAATMLAAEAYRDVAQSLGSTCAAQAIMFANSFERAQKAQSLAGAGPKAGAIKLSAEKLLIDLPACASLFTTGRLPTVSFMEDYYIKLLSHAKNAVDTSSTTASTNRARQESACITGMVGECAVSLLLNRDSMHRVGDGSSLALPSTLRQDRGHTSQGWISPSWDVSVFTDTDRVGSPQLTYKVQVKTAVDEPYMSYADDIAVVDFRRDLAIEEDQSTRKDSSGNRIISPAWVIRELMWEFQGEARQPTIDRINQRTDQLLEKIDPAAA